jgi:hypothetical protein
MFKNTPPSITYCLEMQILWQKYKEKEGDYIETQKGLPLKKEGMWLEKCTQGNL